MYVGFLLFSPLSLLLPSPFLPCFFFFSSPPPFFCAEAIYLNSRDAENENQPGCFFSTLPPLPSSPPPPKKLLPTHAKCLPFIPLSLSLSLSFLYVSPGERRRTEGGFCKEETLLPQTTSACGWVYLQHQPPPHPNFDLSLSLSLSLCRRDDPTQTECSSRCCLPAAGLLLVLLLCCVLITHFT